MPKQVHNTFVQDEEGKPIAVGPINKNIYYSNQATDGSDLNDLDNIARYILAMTHSGWNDPYHIVKQNVTGKKTFAVGASGDTLYVAHNVAMEGGNRPSPNTGEEEGIKNITLGFIKSELKVSKIRDVKVINLAGRGNATSFHAEMQLIAYLKDKGLALDGRIIGVSKPCCGTCGNFLNALGINFSLIGDPPLGQWMIPAEYQGGMLSTNDIPPL
jgi:hypothetical protein